MVQYPTTVDRAFSALADPIHTAADKVDEAVGDVETALATVTTEVQQLFAQLEALLDQVDTTAISTQATGRLMCSAVEIIAAPLT